MDSVEPVPAGRPSPETIKVLFPARSAEIYRYVDLLTSMGTERGVLGPREAPRVWDRHILNCGVIAPVLTPGQSVCDLGSGAGLPGIVIAIARPDLRLTLLEPLLRRVAFLNDVVSDLGLDNVLVRRGRAEDLPDTSGFDVVTARAVAPLDRLAVWALPLLRPGGELLAMKGSQAAEEVASSTEVLSRLGAGPARVETFGLGIVDPPTTVVRIESSTRRRRAKGVRL